MPLEEVRCLDVDICVYIGQSLLLPLVLYDILQSRVVVESACTFESPYIFLLGSSQARVKCVSQAVAQKIERKHGDSQRHSREERLVGICPQDPLAV